MKQGRLLQKAFGSERMMRLTIVKTLRIHYISASSLHPAIRSSHDFTTSMSFEAVSRLFTLDWSLVDLARQFCGLIPQGKCINCSISETKCNGRLSTIERRQLSV